MKYLIQFTALLGLIAAGATAHAAPRAAEEPSAVVISTSESAPVVKRQAPKKAKATPKKSTGSKKAKAAPAKKAKPVKKANKK